MRASLCCSAYRNLGRSDAAIECNRQAISIAPVAANGMLVEIARIFLHEGRLEQAEEHARAVLDSLPVEGNDVLARVAIERRDAAAAQRYAEAAAGAEKVPRAESMILLARTHMLQGRFDQGLALLDQLRARLQVKNVPLPPELEFQRGEALAYLDRSEEAAAAFREEIRCYPGNADAYSRLAFVYAVRKEFDRIDPLLEAMVAANPRRETYLLGGRDRAAARRPGRQQALARAGRCSLNETPSVGRTKTTVGRRWGGACRSGRCRLLRAGCGAATGAFGRCRRSGGRRRSDLRRSRP